MRLISLTLENFMSYVGGPHNVELDRLGLVLLSGRNLDDPANNSNGSGKSTVLEALTWAMFGEGLPRRQGNAERGVTADEVCSDRVGNQTRVEVALEDEITGQRVGVVRWRKYKAVTGGKRDSGVSIRVGDFAAEQYLDITEGDRRIREVLGINRDIWCRSVVFGQESQFNFCEATSKERADILTTVMGLEVVDRWLGRARDERTGRQRELARVEGALEATLKAQAAVRADDPAVRVASWEAARGERLVVAQQRLEAVKGEGLKRKAVFGALVDPAAAVQTAHAEYQAAQDALAHLPVAQQPDQAAVQEAQAALEAVRRDEAVVAAQYQKLGALSGLACPTCLRPIDPAQREQMALELTGKLQAIQGQVGQAQVVYATAQAAWKLAADAAGAQAAEARNAAFQRIQAANTARAAVEAEARGFDNARRALDEARADWTRAAEAVKAIMEESNPFAALVDQRHLRLYELDQEIQKLEAERATEQESIGLLSWWDAEIPRYKTWLFDSIVDALAAEANRWLRVMSAGVIWVQVSTSKQLKSGDLKDELDVQVYRWNPDGSITSRPYRIWSGGEKRRVALAVDLGLSRLMATRAAKAYRFLALDEIDRHLDSQGREGLRSVLEELRTERETCLVVTHDAEFRASFDLELCVTKQAGTSRLEVRRVDQGKANQEAGSAGEGEAEPQGDPAAGSVVPAGPAVRPARKKGARGKRRAGPASGDAGADGGSSPLPGAD